MANPANWPGGAVPGPKDIVSFSLPTGGLLTGVLSVLEAEFSGDGGWVLKGATVTLAGEGDPLAITEAGNVTVDGGTIAAAGSIAIESLSGASMTVFDGAQIGALGVSVGADAGQSGLLIVGGAGTSIQNTGTAGSLLLGGSGSGIVTITGGALLTDTATDTLGANAGGAGELDVSGGASVSDPGLVVGDGGRGSLAITSGGTVVTTPGTAAAVIANQTGAGGSSVNVTGAGSDWQVGGALIVGNAATGLLAITDGGAVSATTLDVGVGVGGAGVVTVSGPEADLLTTGTVSVEIGRAHV
jgi:T5SS/PEP-CTERM-associated repeat protein